MSNFSENDANNERIEKISSYIRRLSDGESLEDVRADFVENFSDVSALEIAQAESKIIASGTPITEVQKLCDVHSALFHGATTSEKIAAAQKAVMDEMAQKNQEAVSSPTSDLDKKEKTKKLIESIRHLKRTTPQPSKTPFAKDPNFDGKKAHNEARDKKEMLVEIKGHPLNILTLENNAISMQVDKMRNAMSKGAPRIGLEMMLEKLWQIGYHYGKKGDLIYPLLKNKYEISGPSDVMWGVDDEIRDEISVLLGRRAKIRSDKEFLNRLSDVLTRISEMVYKENNILFALCAHNFSDEEWIRMAKDFEGYEACLIDDMPKWEKAQNTDMAAYGYENMSENTKNNFIKEEQSYVKKDIENVENRDDTNVNVAILDSSDDKKAANTSNLESSGEQRDANTSASKKSYFENGEVKLPSGHMTPDQICALLNALPMEVTFVDANDINRYFNEGYKYFKRPMMALDRPVYSCHPPKIEPMVKQIIKEFKEGSRDSVEVWNIKEGHPMYVKYIAVRDSDKNFVGTLECVMMMDFAQDHFQNI